MGKKGGSGRWFVRLGELRNKQVGEINMGHHTIDPVPARGIVETLRAGVPSREVSRILLTGRDAQLERCNSDLRALADDKRQRHLVIYSGYGGGKSHLLSAVANLALEQNFAVSQLVLSKETPFNRIQVVYKAAAHTVELPGYAGQGFEEALMKIRPESNEYYDIREYLERHLHPKVLYVSQNYFREGDAYRRSQLYEDLAGAPLTMATLRAMHRANFGEAIHMQRRFLVQQDTPDYFRFLSFLVRRIGYRGWVILLDEAELLARLGIGARAQAYLNLGLLLGLHPTEQIDGLYVVSAFNTAFREDRLLGGSGDLEHAPEWLRDPRRNRPEDAQIVLQVLRKLIDEGVHLPVITPEMADGALQTLQEFHASAYGWDAKLDRDRVLDSTATQLSQGSIRTTIRAGIEYLDVAYQDGTPPSELAIGQPDEGTLDEDASFSASNNERSS